MQLTGIQVQDGVVNVSNPLNADLAFEQIARSIRKDKRFLVPGFGTFSVRQRRASRFQSRTNAPMTIPAARTVGFRPAPQLRKGL